MTAGTGAFSFLGVPARPGKPRLRGLTIVSDRAMALRQSEDLVEVARDVIDWVKFVDHAGFLVRYGADWLRAKTDQYRSVGIGVFPGGIPFEVAALSNKVEEYLRCVADLGFTGVEISDDAMAPMPLGTRRRYIGLARKVGLTVFTEVGRKFPTSAMTVDESAETIRADLDEGAVAVTLEESDLHLAWKTDRRLLPELLSRVGLDQVVFEIGPSGWPQTLIELFREFGTEISVANIEPNQVLICDAMRHGLFWGEGYSLFKLLSRSRGPE